MCSDRGTASKWRRVCLHACPRFSLLGLILVVSAVCFLLSRVGNEVRRNAAAEAIFVRLYAKPQHLGGSDFFPGRKTVVPAPYNGILRYLPSSVTGVREYFYPELPSVVRLPLVTDDDLAGIGALAELREIVCDKSTVTDYGATHLAALRHLEVVWLPSPAIGDATARIFAKMPELMHLGVRGAAISDRGIEELCGLKGLRRLGLGETLLTDAGVAHLATLASIEHLDIGGTSVTDGAVGDLCKIVQRTTFRGLDVTRTRISDAGMKRLWDFVDAVNLTPEVQMRNTFRGVRPPRPLMLNEPRARRSLPR